MRTLIRSFCGAALLAALAVLIPAQVVAAQTEKRAASAVEAFKQGSYSHALTLFQQKESAGNSNPRLKFNIGVTLFKLGRYREASDYFWQLLPNREWRDLAEYNLGLSARRQGDQILAARYFRRVSENSASQKLQRLAAMQLGHGAPAGERSESRPWLATASLNAGFDDNAYAVKNELLADDAAGEDNFFELFAWGQYRLQGSAADGWRLQSYGFSRQYSELDSLNLGSLSAIVLRDRRWQGWALETGAGAELVTLGGEAVSRQLQLIGRLKGEAWGSTFQLSYIPAYYSGGESYAYLDGWRQRFSAKVRWQAFGADFGVYYLFDTNDREDLQQAAADYYSYSPVRHAFGSDVRWRLYSRWELRAGIEYRYSAYDGLNRTADRSGNIIEYERQSDRIKTWLSTRYRLTPRLSVDGKLLKLDNRENRAIYDYDKTEFSLGVSYVF